MSPGPELLYSILVQFILYIDEVPLTMNKGRIPLNGEIRSSGGEFSLTLCVLISYFFVN